MALLRGKLLAGALFAGALFGPVGEQVVVPVAVQQGAGLFRPIRAVSTHVVPGHVLASWNVKFPAPVVRIIIPASSDFISGRALSRWGPAAEPSTGLVSPYVSIKTEIRAYTVIPKAGARASFVSGRGYPIGTVEIPVAGATTSPTHGGVFVSGVILIPTAIKNPTLEMLTFL